jgi:signal transduction histidine kinase
MDYFVFSKISGYYLLLDNDRDPAAIRVQNSHFFLASSIQPLLSLKTVSSEELNDLFQSKLGFQHARYTVSHGHHFLLLLPIESSMFKRRPDIAAVDANHRVTEFELAIKERLIKALYARDTSLGEYAKAWTEYFFFDHYSLWIYNRYTKAFTRSSSSFEYPTNVIFEDEDSAFNAVLASDYETEIRALNQDSVTRDTIGDIQSINRMKLTLGYDGTIGVLTFYSRFKDFSLPSISYGEIHHSIETKYLQVRERAHQAMHQINQQFIEAYETGELDQFLFSISCQITRSFQAEACSIFLVDELQENLHLVASCDSQVDGRPKDAYAYPVDSPAPTVRVFSTREMAFSYDLASDDPNNEGYNETTEHPPKNWIGAPLISAGKCYGTLRVRNKYDIAENGDRVLVNFSTGDFKNLLTLCTNLANLIRIESLFNETEKKLLATNASIEEMNDFNKVFLHEIRTPISKFTMAPEIIKRTLRNKELNEENLAKVMIQLDDIQVMGDRLEFIAKTFNFNQIVTRRNFETLSVLRDIIFPVINITRAYLRKQYDIDIQLSTTGLQSTRVYGDKTLLNIVFNTLIDNAGKYSINTRKPITVSGGFEDNGDFFNIVVSNHGLRIFEDEKDKLFEKGVRGAEARKHGIGGTGIGLHLAHRIMVEGHGNLFLTSLCDPVSFTIRIPARALDK